MAVQGPDWLTTIEPFKWKRHTLRYKGANWPNIPKREFRSFLVRIALKERRSWPGPTRSHWRRKRAEAVKFYEAKWEKVPAVLHGWKIPKGLKLFWSPGWAEWIRS